MLKFVYLRKIHDLNEVIIVDEVCVCVCVYNMYVDIYKRIDIYMYIKYVYIHINV